MLNPNGSSEPSPSGNSSPSAASEEANRAAKRERVWSQYEAELSRSRELDRQIADLRRQLEEGKSQRHTPSSAESDTESNTESDTTPQSPTPTHEQDSDHTAPQSPAPQSPVPAHESASEPTSGPDILESDSARPDRSPDKAMQNPAFVRCLATVLVSSLVIAGISTGVAVSSRNPNSNQITTPDASPRTESSVESTIDPGSLSTTFDELGLDTTSAAPDFTEATIESAVDTAPTGAVAESIIEDTTSAGAAGTSNPAEAIDVVATSETITPITAYTRESMESALGEFEGYDHYGMWLSPSKVNYYSGAEDEYAFAAAQEVASICDGDEREMLKYAAHNQSECLADYIYGFPSGLKPDFLIDYSKQAAESYAEDLNLDGRKQLLEWYDYIIDQAHTRPVTLNGDFASALIKPQDLEGPINHENMELTDCTTSEYGIIATELYWQGDDGGEIGSMIVNIVHDAAGSIIGGGMQVLEPIDGPTS